MRPYYVVTVKILYIIVYFNKSVPAPALGKESGCDPTSLKWDGSYYSDLHKVCNVNNVPKLLPTERNGAGDRQTGVRI